MMHGLAAFLLPDLLALLGDAEGGKKAVDESQSEPMSEDSEPQSSQRAEGFPPRLVLVRSTNSAAQTIVLVDRDHSMEAFVPAKVLEALHAQRKYKSLVRLRGSVLQLVKYRFVTRARCLASGQLQDSAASSWSTSVSMAGSHRRQQRLFLWVEELSVVDASELVVDSLPDVVDNTEVDRLLGTLTDVELEARLAIRQKLPPLLVDASPAEHEAPRFGDGNPLTDMDCIIPEDQERELDEQDGWGPSPPTHSQPLPTDSQLIAENGHVSMTEPQEDSGEQTRSEAREASASFPLEHTSPSNGGAPQEKASSAKKPPGHLSDSETEDEYEHRNSNEGNDSNSDVPPRSPGSDSVPIDLTADDGDDSPGYGSYTLSRADYVYDDSELYTQPPDPPSDSDGPQDKAMFQSQEVTTVNQARQSQPDPETQVLDDPQFSTQPPDDAVDRSLEVDDQETQSDGEAQLPTMKAVSTTRQQLDGDSEAARKYAQGNYEAPGPTQVRLPNEVDITSSHSHEAQDPENDMDTHDADTTIRSSAEQVVISDDARRSDAKTLRTSAEGEDHAYDSSEDVDVDQPRGLGGFFRRLASNLGMVSSRRESNDRPAPRSPGPKGSSAEASDASESGDVETHVSASGDVGSADTAQHYSEDGDNEGRQSQNHEVLPDAEIWQTQAPEVGGLSENESTPSLRPDFGYEQEDVEMSADSDAEPVSADGSQVSTDRNRAETPVGATPKPSPVSAPYQATAAASTVMARCMRESRRDGAVQVAHRVSPQAAHIAERCDLQRESAHSRREAGGDDVEGESTDEQTGTRKRRRLENAPPPPDSSTSSQTSNMFGHASDALVTGPGMSWRHRGFDDFASAAARTPTPAHMRPSKRLVAFFPPLDMNRILQQIADKVED